MQSIIEKTLAIPGISDHLNGRKLYSQLIDSGFNDVRIFSMMRDFSAIEFEDREALFEECFAYRINYLKKECIAHPNDLDAESAYNWMVTALALFENEFYKKNFWYSECDFVGIGRK